MRRSREVACGVTRAVSLDCICCVALILEAMLSSYRSENSHLVHGD